MATSRIERALSQNLAFAGSKSSSSITAGASSKSQVGGFALGVDQYQHRITLEMIITKQEIILVNVGSHDEVYQA